MNRDAEESEAHDWHPEGVVHDPCFLQEYEYLTGLRLIWDEIESGYTLEIELCADRLKTGKGVIVKFENVRNFQLEQFSGYFYQVLNLQVIKLTNGWEGMRYKICSCEQDERISLYCWDYSVCPL